MLYSQWEKLLDMGNTKKDRLQVVAYLRNRKGIMTVNEQHKMILEQFEIVEEFIEFEVGNANDRRRKELKTAIAYSKNHKHPLALATLDGQNRNFHLLSLLATARIPIVVCDNPDLAKPSASKQILKELTKRAEAQSLAASKRQSEALAKSKKQLGSPNPEAGSLVASRKRTKESLEFTKKIGVIIDEIEAEGFTTLQEIATRLKERQVLTFTGNKNWSLGSVRKIRNMWKNVK